jgi:hypothetical protein
MRRVTALDAACATAELLTGAYLVDPGARQASDTHELGGAHLIGGVRQQLTDSRIPPLDVCPEACFALTHTIGPRLQGGCVIGIKHTESV